MYIKKIFISFLLSLIIISNSVYPTDIQERFGAQNKLLYEVFFNGILTGTIEWKYLGQEDVAGKQADVVFIDSDTNIMKLLNLESKEKVFLDVVTHLPLKVERDVVFFGKKEIIKEIYNQDLGYVRIIKTASSSQMITLHPKKPIHNISSLLYFFPKDLVLIKDKELHFNLPTQEVVIKLVSEESIFLGKTKKEVYLLNGRGDKKFNLWLDKKDRTPLKMEFIVPLGKIAIVKKG